MSGRAAFLFRQLGHHHLCQPSSSSAALTKSDRGGADSRPLAAGAGEKEDRHLSRSRRRSPLSTTSPLILIDSPSLLCGGLPLPSHCFQPFFLHTSARLCDRKEESKLAEDSERAKPNPGKTFGKLKLRLRSEEDAAALLAGLKSKERLLLLSALQAKAVPTPPEEDSENGELSSEAAKALFLVNFLPFIGFGFLDNLIMILAGEWIDARLGVVFGMSTMAAAGLGNIISDVAGVGLAHQVEWLVGKLGIRAPALTSEQWDSPKARRAANVGKMVGLVLGCFVGMFPLLFIDHSEEMELKKEMEEQHHSHKQSPK